MSASYTVLRDLCFAFLDRTNITVITLTASFVLYTRSAGVAYFAGGATLCSLSVKAIKKLIRQPRPAHLPGRKAKISYGCGSCARHCKVTERTDLKSAS
ncbi:hypothetical protein CVT26_001213 [Gymnopilus dilepis]|uniref:Uncharacterized protein n=1 Tax=Gymnopilus dilepis TaxID=231916 RepID=A0A409YUG9_9AGAR|nr:hypothetical protein CVT26_001213 [Gymnopilus dilepis]